MNKKIKREIIEWIVFLGVIGGIYFSGWHTEVIGTIQRGVLATGIFTPDPETDKAKPASYDLILQDKDGKLVHLDQWKGKPIFLNFWATWCPPCIAEMPDINALYTEMGDSAHFALISLDDDPQKALEFVDRKGFDFPVYFLKSSLPQVYSSQSIPTTFVISSDGNIVVSNRGMAKYNTRKFREFLLTI